MEPVNTGIRTFHSQFDTAFLNIYPHFISEVNKLLTPENLFITDNQEIADILRSSITTIYTYRSKLKAKALNKETFEDDVRKIATY